MPLLYYFQCGWPVLGAAAGACASGKVSGRSQVKDKFWAKGNCMKCGIIGGQSMVS